MKYKSFWGRLIPGPPNGVWRAYPSRRKDLLRPGWMCSHNSFLRRRRDAEKRVAFHKRDKKSQSARDEIRTAPDYQLFMPPVRRLSAGYRRKVGYSIIKEFVPQSYYYL
jgi:hypothetical protein